MMLPTISCARSRSPPASLSTSAGSNGAPLMPSTPLRRTQQATDLTPPRVMMIPRHITTGEETAARMQYVTSLERPERAAGSSSSASGLLNMTCNGATGSQAIAARTNRSMPTPEGALQHPPSQAARRSGSAAGSSAVSPAQVAAAPVAAPIAQGPTTREAATSCDITPWSALSWTGSPPPVDAPGPRRFAPGWYRRGAWQETWVRDENVIVTQNGHLLVINAPDSDLAVKCAKPPVIPKSLRCRTIWGFTAEEEYVMTLLRCQACAVFMHTSRFDRRVIRRAQYSLLHALDLSHVRRTYKTVWCKDCSERAFDLGNHPEAYTMRIRATVEFLHQDRVVGRLFAVKDSNHLGERLALDPEADQCVREQLSRYWADTDSSDGQSDMMHSEHVSSDDDPVWHEFRAHGSTTIDDDSHQTHTADPSST